jgi:predicted metal-dependent hydrolase
MKARRPKIDFEKALPHWSWHREFAQAFNAASTSLPHLEPYLNKIVRQARDQLSPDNVELIEAARVFMQQEANHYKLHQQYNDTLYRAGYTGLLEHEAGLQADFDRFLHKKSLRFNIAYAEGFESLGIIYAKFFFERIDDLLDGADAAVALLWKWHLAEEFEHRRVCHGLYQALFGGYWSRIYGLLYAFFHLGDYGRKTTQYLIGVDRARMSLKERLGSRWRGFRYQLRLMAFALPRTLAIASPRYDPSRRPEPKGVDALLQSIA